MAYQCVEYTLAVFGFICNLVQIIHISGIASKRKRSRTLFQIFLLSLSLADLLTCIFSFLSTWFFFYKNNNRKIGQSGSEYFVLRRYIEYGYAVSIFLSTAHICLIAGDRFMTVSQPLKHKLLLKQRFRVLHIAIWVVVPLVVSFIIFCERYNKRRGGGKHGGAARTNLLNYCFVTFSSLTSLVCVFVYASIAFSLKRGGGGVSGQNGWRDNRRIHHIRRIYILCFMTTIVFIGCTLPPSFGRLAGCKDLRQFNPFLTLNAGLNSFIYFFYAKLTNACNCCCFYSSGGCCGNSKPNDRLSDIDAIKIEK